MELLPKESRLWSSFSAFLRDNGGIDFIGSFAKCSGCSPGSLCDHCVMDIIDIYVEGCNQITGSMSPILEYSGNSWNSICMRIGTWNSSGLLCTDLGQYKDKMIYFRSILLNLDVLCLQETHDDGNDVQYVDHLHLIGRDFNVWRTFIDAATGGLAFFLRRSFCNLFSCIRQTEIIPGRMLAIELTKDGKTLIIVNIHIHCNPISQPGKIRMLRKLKEFIGRHVECFI